MIEMDGQLSQPKPNKDAAGSDSTHKPTSQGKKVEEHN